MHYLLFIFALIWFAFMAPLKVTVTVCASLLVVTSLVKATAEATVGSCTFQEALKSICLAFVFMAVAAFFLISFNKGTGQGAPLVLVLAGFLCSYILGFKVAIGASFGASAIIAGVATAVSGVLYVAARSVIA